MNNPADAHTTISAIKLALMAKQVRAQAERVLRADPIAIVGMACRVPGGGDTPELFWQRLCTASTPFGKFPPTVGMAMPGTTLIYRPRRRSATKWGGFLDRIDAFDAGLFWDSAARS